MKIKLIEIQGFKSFGEKQVLELNPRTNVIVGPNGSGKSNLIDAVNWVLGEQSPRSLRGERMEDIIFSGSAAKKPVGMAQVVLHIDNADGDLPLDYHELTLTRRFFRSGESQFLINKIPCRLKDIRELFMGTGSGRGSLSIISQGQVDQVLNAKPSQRREVFEEAAGITKFRVRCQDANNQLSKLEADAETLSHLAAEIENNMSVLKHEAGKARQYLELRQEGNYFESLLLTKKAKKLFIEAARCRWRRDELSLWLDKAMLQKKHFEELLFQPVQELKVKRPEKEEAVKEGIRVQLESEHLSDRLQMAQDKKAWLEGRKEECLTFLEKSTGDMSGLELKQTAEKENCEKLLQDIQDCRAEYTFLVEKEEEINANLTLTESKAKRISGTYVEVLSEQSKNSNLLSGAEKESLINKTERAKIDARLEEFQQNSLELKTKIALDQKTRKGLEQSLQTLKGETAACEKNIEQLELSLSQVNLKLQKNRDKHSEISSRQKLLTEMHKKYEGYAYPVQELLNKGGHLPGICGVVGDLLEVPEAYRVAIEVALGAKINNVVTDSTEAAKTAISFLKERNAGRLTFLPLDMLQEREASKELTDLSEGLLATALVTIEDKYKPVVNYLLGRILIVDNLEVALKLARKLKFKYTIVTVQGEMLHPGGALTGGSLKKIAGGVVGRKKTVQQLGSETVRLEEILAVLNRNRESVQKAIGEERSKLRLAGDNITKVSMRIQELETGIEYAGNQTASLDRESKVMREEKARLATDQEENVLRVAELIRKKALLEQKINKVKDITGRREDRLKVLKQEANWCREALTNAEVKLSTLEQKYEYVKQNIEQLRGLQADMSLRHQERSLDFEKCQKDALELNGEITEITGIISLKQKRLAALVQLQKQLDEVIAFLGKKEQNCSRVVGRLSSEIPRLDQEYSHCQSHWATLSIEIKGLDHSMEDNRGLRFIQLYPGCPDLHSLQVKAAALRRQMHALEPVNLSSIEEYARIERERAGLSEQVEDIKQAQLHLRQVLHLVEGRMRKQFRDFFSRLQVTFNETYLRVFGGGSAQLLLQEDNVLEGEIDIMVQPPGKRAQSLLLLSGGERALTALTLLFAILQENCSPFCILDEVDTSLDENNIEHFTRMLEYYSAVTQFIVVSHRQGTMEAADNLFGVTMPEDGVSAIVSVNFEREAG